MNRTHHPRIPVRDLGFGATRRRGLERVLTGMGGVLSTSINPATETAYLEVDPAHVDVNAVTRAIADGSFLPGRPVLDQQDPASRPKETLTMHEHHDKPQATDPVCGMRVAHDTAVVVEYRGATYRFCDPACAETFRDEPERWVGAGDKPGFTHSHSD